MADGGEVSGRSDRCQPCSRKGRMNAAVKFCDTCQRSFCSTCLGYHDELYDHLQVQGADGGGTYAVSEESTEFCDEHKLPITLYCNEEDKFGCVTCMDADHKSCKQLIYLPAAAKALLGNTDFEQLNELLGQTTQELESIKRKQQSSLSSLVEDNKECIQDVTEYYTRLLETLSVIFKSTSEMIQQTFESMRAEVEKNIQNVEDCLTDLEASRSRLQQFQNNNTKFFIEVRKCQKRLDTAEKVSADASDNLKIKGMGVVIDRRLENLLTELRTLSNVARRKAIELKKTYTIDLSVDSDSLVCDFSSTCIVKDGSFLVVDHTNKRVNHIDGRSLRTIDTCAMQTEPVGICCIDDNEAVVTCYNKQMVHISIYPRLSIIHTIHFKHQCKYVAYYDGELFITDLKETLYVHSLQGSLRREITFYSGRKLFSEARHVNVNGTGDKIFVADWDNGIVVINRSGVVIDTFDNNKLTCIGTWGACLDDAGGVFVCDHTTSKVVHADHKGRVVDILTAADGLRHPISVCYDRKHRRLLVSQEANNHMLVCELL